MAKKEKHHEKVHTEKKEDKPGDVSHEVMSHEIETGNVPAVPAAANTAQGKITFLGRLKILVFKPGRFIESIEKEDEYLPGLIFLAIIIAISQAVSIIIALPNTNFSDLKAMIFNSIVNIVLAFVIPFIFGGIAHLGIIIFGGKKGFFSTCKPVIYGLSLMVVYSTVIVLVMAVYNLAFPIDASALDALNEKLGSGTFTYEDFGMLKDRVAIMGIIALAAVVHGFYFMTLGVARLHGIKKWRAFVGIIFFNVILSILLIYIMSLALSQMSQMNSLQGNLG